MDKIYKVIVVGGGSAGLMACIELLKGQSKLDGNDVLLLERTDRVGKKLIATGNGQGNLLNKNFSSEYYYGDKEFIKGFFESISDINLEEYLYNIGVPVVYESSGKGYPVSKQASAVLDIFREILSNANLNIKTNSFVQSVKKEKGYFVVKDESETFYAQNVILAVGGCSQKQFGTDGSSYKLAESFSHKKTPIYPSLVQLKTDTQKIKGLKGLKEYVKLSSYVNGQLLMAVKGDLLFTDYGVSGSSVFSISASITDKEKAYLIVEFLPEFSESELEKLISDKLKNLPFIKISDVLCGLINKRIGQQVLKSAKSLSVKDIVYELKNFKLDVKGTTGFNYSQVTKGGIETDFIDYKNLSSKNQEGLYLVGEMLNVDGDCGGYNISFAFLSAILSAKDIKRKIKGEN